MLSRDSIKYNDYIIIGVILYNKDLKKFVQLNWVFFIMKTVPFFDTILASGSLNVAPNKRYTKEMEKITHIMKAGNTLK